MPTKHELKAAVSTMSNHPFVAAFSEQSMHEEEEPRGNFTEGLGTRTFPQVWLGKVTMEF